jgi:Prenyltransferase and squalene oxidase repeat
MVVKNFIHLSITVLLTSNLCYGAAFAKSTEPADKVVASDFAPKPLDENALKGIDYLVKEQNSDGSWSQGEESKYMASAGQHNGDIHNVADTCMAALALVRAGNLPDTGKYATNVKKATEYVCKSIEDSDQDGLFITTVRGTRVQVKLGQYVDTFLASVFLPEVKAHMVTPDEKERVATALSKVIHKIEKNQGADGSFANGGWAPIHSQALALQGLNRAAQVGMPVNQQALDRAESYSRKTFDSKNLSFLPSGSAGVPLYSAGSYLGGMQSSINTYDMRRGELEKKSVDAALPKPEREKAAKVLQNYKDEADEQNAAVGAVAKQLNDKGFVQGFGCNGGEEFLSYYQISQTLVAKQSKDWKDWNKNITANLDHIQNPDGSWMGQHCITSRTFCTAAALLVMTADRAPNAKAIASAK